MPVHSLVMAAIAAVLALVGIGLLVALRKPGSDGRTYAYRMVGVMALAGATILAASALTTAWWIAA